MEKKKINIDKILKRIQKEEKLQREKLKQIWYNYQLKESQRDKLGDWIGNSRKKILKLKEMIKNK